MTVHAASEYAIIPEKQPPPGYPTSSKPDPYHTTPLVEPYANRREAYIQHCLNNPAPANTKPVWHELVRMEGGAAPHDGIFQAACKFVNARNDCSDFVLHGLLRTAYKLQSITDGEKNPPVTQLTPETQREIKNTILNFKYFPDEPGIDSLCTWTENHYILFTSAGFLAGKLYPNGIFTNSGQPGSDKSSLNRGRILKWMDLRFKTGFSEWLSHVYYDEDLTALLSIIDLSEDNELITKARMIVDLLLLDIALNSYKGVFGSTHGRSYENTKKYASNEGTTDTSKLLFGMGTYSSFDNMSAAAFTLSSYTVPPVIEKIAQTLDGPLINRQRMGIKLDDMEKWGLYPDNFEDGMHYLTLEAYIHPKTINNTLQMFDICNWWENSFLDAFKPYRGFLKFLRTFNALPALAQLVERDACRNTREEVNIYTYKTKDYMLSTAQDYRKGYGGDQHHIWQATLGPDAVCFTTHPAKIEGETPNYWAGSGLLPRAAQYKSVCVVIYKIEKIPALYVPIRHFFTHAWLPKEKFDDIEEQDGWVCARKDDGYLALRSMQPYIWATKSIDEKTKKIVQTQSADEIIAHGKNNVWVCQVGSKSEFGAFSHFIKAILSAKLSFTDLSVAFDSPKNGSIAFGWEDLLRVNGDEIPLSNYPRYDNPYTLTDFPTEEIRVQLSIDRLYLNWRTSKRLVTTD